MSLTQQQAPAARAQILRFLRVIWQEGDVRETRIPKHNKYGHTASGYFESPEALVATALPWDGRANIFVTLNPVNPALLGRAAGRIIDNAEHTTSDADIVERRWLFVDIDSVRPSGISASDEELECARQLAHQVAAALEEDGWPEPLVAMSGNGCYLLYRLDLPNDEASRNLVANLLKSLAARFNTDRAHIDTTVSNAARIIGLLGTLKVKGDEVGDRVHRRSRIETLPANLLPVGRDLLRESAEDGDGDGEVGRAERAVPIPRLQTRAKALADRLRAAGHEFREQPPDAAGFTWYHLKRCPWHEDGRPFECGVGQRLPDGPMAGHCFHPEGSGKVWSDWRETLDLRKGVRVKAVARTVGAAGALPEIMIRDRQLHEIAADAWRVVHQKNEPPLLFEHTRTVAQIIRADDGPRIEHHNVVTLKGHIDRIARWTTVNRNGETVAARPPKDVVEDMLATPQLPKLRGLVAAPIVTRSGEIVTAPGYHEESSLFYWHDSEPVPALPVSPTEDDLALARSLLLNEWLVDFPFPNAASRVHAVAAVLTVVARELFSGPAPLFGIDAPTQGTGKTFLAQSIAVICLGGQTPVTTLPHDDDELRKRITALLWRGASIVQLDNVKGKIQSPNLAALLTGETWEDRLLATNRTLVLPNRALWVVTGNNLQFDGDMTRRTAWSRLDASVDRPWERDGFKHDPFLPWVAEARPELLWAFLVLCRNWIAKGRPPWRGKPMGSFESWSQVIGGILESAGLDGFLANREELYARVDPESLEWQAFVEWWWDEFADSPVGVADLFPLVQRRDALSSLFATARADASERSLKTRLGTALKGHADRVYEGLAIRPCGTDTRTKAQIFRLVPTEPSPEGSAEVPSNNPSIPDSNAEPPEPSEPVSQPYAREDTDWGWDEEIQEAPPFEVPKVPYVPFADSDVAPQSAEPRLVEERKVPQVPRPGLVSSVTTDDGSEAAAVPGAAAGRRCPRCGVRPTTGDRLCFKCERDR